MDSYDSDNYFGEENSQLADDSDKPTYTSPSPGKGVSSSVQEFLKQSNEIQEEIRKLSELCQQISPKKDSFIEEAPKEKEDYEENHVAWDEINNLLNSHGFNTLALYTDEYDQEVPDPVSIQDSVVELITEYSNLYRNYEEISNSYKELEEEYKSKSNQIERNKSMEEKMKNLDKINRQLQEKVNKQQELLKGKEEALIKVSTQRNKSLGDRPINVFKAFMEQEYNPMRDNDAKVMAIIQNYEEQVQKLLKDLNSSKREIDSMNQSFKRLKDRSVESENSYHHSKVTNDVEIQDKLKVLQSAVSQLSLKSYNEIPKALNKIQQVMLTLPGIDRFVKQICEEVMLSPASRLEEVVETLREMKRKCSAGDKFKNTVFEQFGANSDHEVFERVKGYLYFCKLFEIRPRDDIVASIESIFFFVHEIKMFLAVRSI